MLKLFKKIDSMLSDDRQVVEVENRSTKEIIEEIHESFYTEVDKLLAEAKISRPVETNMADLIEKRDRLIRLGFTKTKEVVEASKEVERLSLIRAENEQKQQLVDAINYFSFKYPNYKFITEESVKKICQKYGLVYGEVNRYKGTVPDKNLKHIEDFKIAEDDECYFYSRVGLRWGSANVIYTYYLSKKQYSEQKPDHLYRDVYVRYVSGICPLEIAAPVSDFNMENMEVKDFKLSAIPIPDPVVLKPVHYKGKKHYLIVTAWGDEASDELVVNQKMN